MRIVAAIFCVIVLLPLVAAASEFESKKDLHISNLHQIDDDLYVFGEKLQMDGSISGDLVVFCYDARMAGTVGGSANLFCRSVRQSGTILHSLRTFSEEATIEGNISGSYLGLGRRIDVGKGAVIERDLTVYATDANIEGLVKGKAKIEGVRITLAGTIEGDVLVRGEKISIIPPAIIRGALVYESEKPEALDTTSGIILAGGVKWQLPKTDEEKKDEQPNYVRKIVIEISGMLAAFLFGIIVVALFRPFAAASVDQLTRRTSVSFAAGLLTLGILLVAIAVLLFSILAAIAGVIMVGGSLAIVGAMILIFSTLMIPISGFVTFVGFAAVYTAKIVAAFVVGALVLRRADNGDDRLGKLTLLVGLVILTACFAIPYVGWLAGLVVACFGAGAIVLGVRSCRLHVPGAMNNASADAMQPPAS